LALQAIEPPNGSVSTDTLIDALNLDRCPRIYIPMIFNRAVGLTE
jgi:hypothetical protein